MYGNYAAQPELGYLTRREGILTSGSVKVASNWVVQGAARWDLEANKINQYVVGAGYVDDCFVLAANYVTSYTYTAGFAPPDAQPRLHVPDRPADHRATSVDEQLGWPPVASGSGCFRRGAWRMGLNCLRARGFRA